jgi:cyclophilin family peptidyl-prolyl cis-trans isomerase
VIVRLARLIALGTAMALVVGACGVDAGRSTAEAGSPVPVGPGAIGGCPASPPEPLAAGQTRTVTIATPMGSMVITVDAALSPIAAANFVALAECGYYDGVVFHRVVPGFVIQGGDPTGTGTGGPGYTIPDEPVTAAYRRGVVAMARTSQPDSVGSQFFIVLDDAAAERSLTPVNTYQIIGSVTTGMDTVDAIAAAADRELPSDPVVMTDVSVTNP